MRLSGFQRLSLIDYPGVIASVLFTQGCPFRCAYCHNPDLIPVASSGVNMPEAIAPESVLAYFDAHKNMLEGVCITGGEPTIHADLPDFIKKIKDQGLLVKLDTNGVNPRMVQALVDERLVDFIAMDLKHAWHRYTEVTGPLPEAAIENCRETFKIIQNADIPHEFRTTVYAGFHDAQDLHDIAGMLKPYERYALQAIRYEKVLKEGLEKKAPLPLKKIVSDLHQAYPTLQLELRGT